MRDLELGISEEERKMKNRKEGGKVYVHSATSGKGGEMSSSPYSFFVESRV